MTNHFTGVQVVEDVDPELVDAAYDGGKLNVEQIPSTPFRPYPNSFVVLKGGGRSALCRVEPDGKTFRLIRTDLINASGIRPKNKEQAMLLSTLLDDRVLVQVITGKAGTGKTLLALATAMQKIDEGVYDKIILTRPMSQVGKYELGILPGNVEEKFAPFLINYASNFEQIVDPKSIRKAERQKTKGVGEQPQDPHGLSGLMRHLMQFYKIEIIPFQLIRGASLKNAFVIADEVQVVSKGEMLTLGTRIAEGSKLVIMGDLAQRDEKIRRTDTGLYKTTNDERMLTSGLVSYIELRKVERGPVADLFGRVFEEDEQN